MTTSAATRCQTKTSMMCVLARAFNVNTLESVEVTVFIDTGSSVSYISSRLARLLNLLEGQEETICVSRFGEKGKGPLELATCQVQIGLLP